jgi:hypothetical protein
MSHFKTWGLRRELSEEIILEIRRLMEGVG